VIGCTYEGYPTRSVPVRNVLGCNMAFRRTLLSSTGGFRRELGRVGTLPFGVEETEVCIRLSAAMPGTSILHVPAAMVRHSVPVNRATWRYFRRRCFAEGVSKAILTRLVGQPQALATERRYASSVLPRGVVRSLRDAVRHRRPGHHRRRLWLGPRQQPSRSLVDPQQLGVIETLYSAARSMPRNESTSKRRQTLPRRGKHHHDYRPQVIARPPGQLLDSAE
jgi:hypothetical protein